MEKINTVILVGILVILALLAFFTFFKSESGVEGKISVLAQAVGVSVAVAALLAIFSIIIFVIIVFVLANWGSRIMEKRDIERAQSKIRLGVRTAHDMGEAAS
jgi:uncharacterized membrane protein